MIKIYFKNTGMSGSADTVEYPNADGYGFKDADWITIKVGTEIVRGDRGFRNSAHRRRCW